jgi:hypothetical protein
MPTTLTRNPIVGELITLKAEFIQKGADADPDGVIFSFRKPGAATPTSYTYGSGPQIYRDTVPVNGIYYIDLSLDTPGRWYWGWYASGRGQTVSEGYIDVQPSQVFH